MLDAIPWGWFLAFCVLAILGLTIGFHSVVRGHLERRLCREAKRLADQGEVRQALKRLLQAESKWMVNSHSGSVASCLRDYDRLADIARQMERLSISAQGSVDVSRLVEAIDCIKECLANKANHPLDERIMTSSAAKESVFLQDTIQTCRMALRSEVMRVVREEAEDNRNSH